MGDPKRPSQPAGSSLHSASDEPVLPKQSPVTALGSASGLLASPIFNRVTAAVTTILGRATKRNELVEGGRAPKESRSTDSPDEPNRDDITPDDPTDADDAAPADTVDCDSDDPGDTDDSIDDTPGDGDYGDYDGDGGGGGYDGGDDYYGGS